MATLIATSCRSMVLCLALAACAPQAGDVPVRSDYAPVVDAITPFIEWHMETKDLPALSIALVDDQEIVWARGFGFSRPDESVPATAQTVYRVGSVSKLFTDIAIMQLVELGELDLDAPVTTYLSDFQPHNPYDTPITLRQLISHRSGLVREPPVGHYFDDTEPPLAQTVQSLNATELVYEPETRIKYSNAAIATVGYVLEHIQDVPFSEYVKRAVLEPLGMTRSAFAPEPDIVEDLATAYMWAFDGREYAAPGFQLGMGPAGSMYSTVTDLGYFMSALFAGGERDGNRILEQETLESMWVPQFADSGARSGYGLGFNIRALDDHRRIGHGGAIYGFATELAMLPDDKLGVIVVTSRDIANPVLRVIADAALRGMLAVKDGAEIERPPRTEPIPTETVRALAGRYMIGDAGLDLYDWGDALVGVLMRGGTPFQLKVRNDTLVIDGVNDQGGWLLPLGPDTLVVGPDTLLRTVRTRPPPQAPQRWRGLIGEYGWDHNTLFVFEKDEQLQALIEWVFLYPLSEVSRDTFAFPPFGLYHGEQLIFERGANDQATQVEAASVIFKRRAVGPGEGGTFRIDPLQPVEALKRLALAASPPEQEGDLLEPDLVELASLEPTIKLDIRYATTNNFMGAAFYDAPRAYMQRPAAEALARVHRALADLGYGLLIHDAYRPWHVTKMFWDATPVDQRIFVANPANGSRHNRGAALDLTLYDLRTGEPVEMVGTYDEFTERSYPHYMGGTSRQRWHRDLLRRAMQAEDFAVYRFEWWHFDYRTWARYPVLNVTFGTTP